MKELILDSDWDELPPRPISIHARHIDARRIERMVNGSPQLFVRPLPVMDWTERQNRRERARMRRHDRIEAALVLGLGAVLAVVLLALHVAPWVGR